MIIHHLILYAFSGHASNTDAAFLTPPSFGSTSSLATRAAFAPRKTLPQSHPPFRRYDGVSSSVLFNSQQSSSSSSSSTTGPKRNDLDEMKDIATTTGTVGSVDARRRVLLGRKGPHFALDRSSGQIEFGATARLVTELDDNDDDQTLTSSPDCIYDWLRDEQSFAMSIWRPDLIEKSSSESSLYRLQLMTLNFLTLSLAPWVDMRMKTVEDKQGLPVFTLQSVGFDPNVQILPGMRISAETLGIVIEVAGQLRASTDGKGVTGSIAFETQGKLPVAFRVFPDAVLKRASDTINNTVVNFAIRSFQQGARENYKDFLKKRAQQQT